VCIAKPVSNKSCKSAPKTGGSHKSACAKSAKNTGGSHKSGCNKIAAKSAPKTNKSCKSGADKHRFLFWVTMACKYNFASF